MEAKHTATPWEVDTEFGAPYHIYHINGGLNAQIAYVDGVTQHGNIAKANAAYIVKCVNSHKHLTTTLKHCQAIVASHKHIAGDDWEALFKEIVSTLEVTSND